MYDLESIIREYIPEAVSWHVGYRRKAIIFNPNNSVYDGEYEAISIEYKDKYTAEYGDIIWLKNGKFFGMRNSRIAEYDVLVRYGFCSADTDLYEYTLLNKMDDINRTDVILENLTFDSLSKNHSVREYVQHLDVVEDAKYDDKWSDKIKAKVTNAQDFEEKEIPSTLLANLIKWMRNKGISEEDIVDCMLYIWEKHIIDNRI